MPISCSCKRPDSGAVCTSRSWPRPDNRQRHFASSAGSGADNNAEPRKVFSKSQLSSAHVLQTTSIPQTSSIQIGTHRAWTSHFSRRTGSVDGDGHMFALQSWPRQHRWRINLLARTSSRDGLKMSGQMVVLKPAQRHIRMHCAPYAYYRPSKEHGQKR
jgi:hypothetical protein